MGDLHSSKAAAYAAVINALPKDQPQLVAEVFAEMKSRRGRGQLGGPMAWNRYTKKHQKTTMET